MYQVLKNHDPILKTETEILLKVASGSQQKDIMEKMHNALWGYLKEHLDNFKIKLTVEVGASESKKNVIYTSADKYNYLAEQNEMLNELKKKFNLDLE